MMINVFVYGTLKKGGRYHHLLEDSEFLGDDDTVDSYTLRSLGPFPGVTLESCIKIKGELYSINENILKKLDILEGYPHFYNRIIIGLESGNNAWMYYLTDSEEYITCPIIESGEWNNGTFS